MNYWYILLPVLLIAGVIIFFVMREMVDRIVVSTTCLLMFILIAAVAIYCYKNRYAEKQSVEKYSVGKDSVVKDDRTNQCSVYVNSFVNAHTNVDDLTQYRFFNWCEEYKNKTQQYPNYRTAEIAFNKLIGFGDMNI